MNLRAFAANSHKGNVKAFNEDRICIVTRLSNEHPDTSIFAVYDGHGGQGCAEYLKEIIPKLIVKQECLRSEPE